MAQHWISRRGVPRQIGTCVLIETFVRVSLNNIVHTAPYENILPIERKLEGREGAWEELKIIPLPAD